MATTTKRLNKYISDTGFCSRREADKLIGTGEVLVNGQTPELGTKIGPNDTVTVRGKIIQAVAEDKSDRVYIAYHKPVGITCTTEKHVKGNIVDAVGFEQRIFPIGRLDKPSEGLILLTSDGDIVNKILRARNNHEKEYIVHVNKPVNHEFISRMRNGLPILGTKTKKCFVEQIGPQAFRIILTQGLNRQIRRMCEYLDFRVTKLKRIRIMNIQLNLEVGHWRDLTKDELTELIKLCSHSSKTK